MGNENSSERIAAHNNQLTKEQIEEYVRKITLLQKQVDDCKCTAYRDEINSLKQENYELQKQIFMKRRNDEGKYAGGEQLVQKLLQANSCKCSEYVEEIDSIKHKHIDLKNENTISRMNEQQATTLKNEFSQQCSQLKRTNAKLKNELDKYKSIPTVSKILSLYDSLQTFHKDIKIAEADNSIEEQKQSFTKKIESRKLENESIGQTIDQEKMRQLIEAEIILIDINNNLESYINNKNIKLSALFKNVKTCLEEFDNVSDSLRKIETQLEYYKKEFTALQNEGDELKQQEQKQCNKILALLTSETEEDDNISVASDNSENQRKDYAVILYNLQESPNDKTNVIQIIRSICKYITEEDIVHVHRLGAYKSNVNRPVKVFVPTFKCVTAILSSKWKLKETPHKLIRIVPFNKKNKSAKD